MNRACHRIIFNASRGQRMAVAETASSHSGSSGGSDGSGSGSGTRFTNGSSNGFTALATAIAAALLFTAPAFAPTALAQTVTTVTLNPTAPASGPSAPSTQPTTLTTTASGITQVNIAGTVNGVSRNRYTQFDVGSSGLILNNSVTNSKTQLAGWVSGNTNLASGSASVILNEVSSTNPSQLRGYIEVAGQKADVVIANPAGIAVNGGGFINANGVTLTTGAPQYSGNTLTGYSVSGGNITVSGTGLDTSTAASTTLQAQRIVLQGGVWANDLTVKADNSAGATNAVAIDVSAIGGMYAGKITVIATGAGAGVNNAGTIQANNTGLTLNADGTLTNTGVIDSVSTTRIHAATVDNSTGGAIYGGSVAIAANTLTNKAATPTGTAPATSPVIAARDASGRVDLGVGTLLNQDDALIYSAGSMHIGGALDANGHATGRATSITNNSATLEAAGDMGITTQAFTNAYPDLSYRIEVDHTTSSTADESCGSDCTFSWKDTYYKAVTLAGAHGQAKITSGGNITLDASTLAENSSSSIMAAGQINSIGSASLNSHGIDLDTQIRTQRVVTTKQGYMDNEVDCILPGIGCHSEHKTHITVSAPAPSPATQPEHDTVGPATEQKNTAYTTSPGATSLPNSALFAVGNNNSYLIQTDPRFTNKQKWLSSDYMLQALTVDPDMTQKRLGDGFYEQRLINEQIARLTGYRRLANYTSDQQQYQALMDSGITFARAYGLRVGVALTAEQMAALTSDIVWLVQREVDVPGTPGASGQPATKQKVLVPQVYAVPRAGDLQANGGLLATALISGNQVVVNTAGDIKTDHATLLGRELVQLTAQNIQNLGGQIQGNTVALNASQDIEVLGGSVQAGQALAAQAGRDIRVESQLDYNALLESAPTAAGRTQDKASTTGTHYSSNGIKRLAGLYVTGQDGVLLASAGRDINLTGAVVQNDQGFSALNAGRDINLATVRTSTALDATMDSGNYNRVTTSQDVGSQVSSGSLVLQAAGDINARAANVQAAQSLQASATNIRLQAGQASTEIDSSRQTHNSAFLSSSTTIDRQSSQTTQNLGSSFEGGSVTLRSSKDTQLQASNVIADGNVTIAAGGKVTIEALSDSSTSSHFHSASESGLMGNGDSLSVSAGTRYQDQGTKSRSTQAAASTVGSTGRYGSGNVTITAGDTYTQTGSDIVTPQGDTTITAKDVLITTAEQTSDSTTQTHTRQDGFTVALTNSAVSAAQSADAQEKAKQSTKSARFKALASANQAMQAYNLYSQGKSGASDVGINVSVGSSQSQSSSTQSATTQRGSSITTGGKLHITATTKDITVIGSDLTATGDATGDTSEVSLNAKQQIKLLASANTSSEHSENTNSSASVGVGFSTQKSLNVNASAAGGNGDGNGQSTSYNNTHVKGKSVKLQSGSDTTLQGAVVAGDTVQAKVGGKLTIESLQDSSTYSEQSQSWSASGNVGTGGGGATVGGSKTTIDSTYRSVTEQSGIRAGDGGFQVEVAGSTTLMGGAITSTDKAVDNKANSFTTASLSTKDLQNSAAYSADSASISIGVGNQAGGSAGIGHDEGNAASTTKAGISGIAGNKAARTGDKETGIAPIFDKEAAAKEVNAQVQISQEFGKQAYASTASFFNSKKLSLQAKLKDPKVSTQDKKQAMDDLYALSMQQKALNILIGALVGLPGQAVTQASLGIAADQMRKLMIEDSQKFPGVVDIKNNVLSNVSGSSDGMNGDGIKLGGVRVDLDLLCGTNNSRCEIPRNSDGSLNVTNPVVFTGGLNSEGTPSQTLVQFLDSDAGKAMAGPTGGIQGSKGTFFGIPYASGDWLDQLVEAFAGPHDMIGGKLTGLYDEQGNITRDMSSTRRKTYDYAVTTTAIPIALPFAAAQGLPPSVWNALSLLFSAAGK